MLKAFELCPLGASAQAASYISTIAEWLALEHTLAMAHSFEPKAFSEVGGNSSMPMASRPCQPA